MSPPLEYPELTLPEWVDMAANRYPERPAVIFEKNVISYRQLCTMSLSLADSFSRFNLGKGSRVGLFMNNCPQFLISILAVLRIGAVAVNNISPMCVEREFTVILKDNDVDAIVVETSLWSKLKNNLETITPKLVVFTTPDDLSIPILPGRSLKMPDTEVASETFLNLISGETPGDFISCEPGRYCSFSTDRRVHPAYPRPACLPHGNLIPHITPGPLPP